MNIFTYLALLITCMSLASICDNIWLSYVRPYLTRSRGWPAAREDERIPTAAWVGGALVLAIMFVFLPFVGAAAGY